MASLEERTSWEIKAGINTFPASEGSQVHALCITQYISLIASISYRYHPE